MIRSAIYVVLVGLMLTGATPALAADGVVISYADPVKPDRDLTAFVSGLRKRLASGRKSDYRAIEKLFAPEVLTFQRSLDPLQPWNPTDPISGNYLKGAIDVMVEQGAPPENAPIPDFRPDLMKQLLGLLPDDVVYGRIAGVDDSVCAPASYQYDRDAASAFAATNEDGVSSLRFYAKAVEMKKRPSPDAASSGELPPFTLASFIYDSKAPSDWALLVASNGARGYVPDGQQLYLSQQHICFGKIRGRYRITALFGYGL
jgi:hypothetical protein